jgi:hypothetical protein
MHQNYPSSQSIRILRCLSTYFIFAYGGRWRARKEGSNCLIIGSFPNRKKGTVGHGQGYSVGFPSIFIEITIHHFLFSHPATASAAPYTYIQQSQSKIPHQHPQQLPSNFPVQAQLNPATQQPALQALPRVPPSYQPPPGRCYNVVANCDPSTRSLPVPTSGR